MKKLNLASIAMASAIAFGGMFGATAAQAEVSYNIGVHSKYLLRGIGEENSGAAVQGGTDWSSDTSGWYAGWWFSSLGYSYEADGTYTTDTVSTDGKTNRKGFENDLYAGYSGQITKTIGFDVGLIQYVYVNVDDSDLLEATGKLTFSDFYVRGQYLLTDGFWGNSGDIYWTAGWSTDLPKDMSLSLDYGYYTYNDSDQAKLGPAGTTTSSGGFRHFNVTVSKPIGKTGADAYVQYVFAGEDRSGTKYNDSMIAGITYSF